MFASEWYFHSWEFSDRWQQVAFDQTVSDARTFEASPEWLAWDGPGPYPLLVSLTLASLTFVSLSLASTMLPQLFRSSLGESLFQELTDWRSRAGR